VPLGGTLAVARVMEAAVVVDTVAVPLAVK
jgi:hypothetical protein